MVQTVTDNVRKAETTDDIDLNTGLSKDEIAQRKAFLQVLASRTFQRAHPSRTCLHSVPLCHLETNSDLQAVFSGGS